MLSTVLTVLGVLFNPWTALLVLALAAISAAIYYIPFLGGPVKLLQFWADPSTWIGIGGALALIYVANATHVIQQQQQQIGQQQGVISAQGDSADAVAGNQKKKQSAASSQQRIQNAITQAPTGDEEDAVLDQIAKEQCADPLYSGKSDCVLKSDSK